jgi:opacity protein-like surface antigen
MAVRLGNFLFWLCIIIAGAWLLLAHSMGVDQDSPAMVYGGAGIALAVGWALRYIARRRLG